MLSCLTPTQPRTTSSSSTLKLRACAPRCRSIVGSVGRSFVCSFARAQATTSLIAPVATTEELDDDHDPDGGLKLFQVLCHGGGGVVGVLCVEHLTIRLQCFDNSCISIISFMRCALAGIGVVVVCWHGLKTMNGAVNSARLRNVVGLVVSVLTIPCLGVPCPG